MNEINVHGTDCVHRSIERKERIEIKDTGRCTQKHGICIQGHEFLLLSKFKLMRNS
jgi:hypothetical protein